jgi:hypothetical protein
MLVNIYLSRRCNILHYSNLLITVIYFYTLKLTYSIWIFCKRDRPKLLGPEDDAPSKRRQTPVNNASFSIIHECLSPPPCEPQILQTTLFLPRSCDL